MSAAMVVASSTMGVAKVREEICIWRLTFFFISSSFLVDYVIWRAGVKENSILSSWPATSRHHRSWLAWFPDGAL